MQTLSSARVQSNFGVAADIAKAGESVTITQYGRPSLMLFSYKEGQELLRYKSLAKLSHYFEGRANTAPSDMPALDMDALNDLVHELRP